MWILVGPKIQTAKSAEVDAHVGPDALVWAAGRQPGGGLLRDHSLPNSQRVVLPVCFPSNAPPLLDNNFLKPSFARLGRRGVCPYAKHEAALFQTSGIRVFLSLFTRAVKDRELIALAAVSIAARAGFQEHLYRVCKKNYVWLGSGTSAWAFTVLS
jgi:hypothetical protein